MGLKSLLLGCLSPSKKNTNVPSNNFHEPIELTIYRRLRKDPSTDSGVYLSVREKSRLLLKTGTDIGNADGSAYTNVLLSNLLVEQNRR